MEEYINGLAILYMATYRWNASFMPTNGLNKPT